MPVTTSSVWLARAGHTSWRMVSVTLVAKPSQAATSVPQEASVHLVSTLRLSTAVTAVVSSVLKPSPTVPNVTTLTSVQSVSLDSSCWMAVVSTLRRLSQDVRTSEWMVSAVNATSRIPSTRSITSASTAKQPTQDVTTAMKTESA